MTKTLRSVVCALAFALFGPAAFAQGASNYPNKPVRFIVPFPAGQATDLIARLLAEKLATHWGQAVYVENRGGGNSIPGMMAGRQAAPDGYSITVGATSSTVINEAIYPNLSYSMRDFVAVAPIFLQPWFLVANVNAPYNNLSELIAAAKKEPGKLSWGVSATGLELAGEMLKQRTGMDILAVQYKGSSMAINDLIAGHIMLAVDTTAAALPHIRSGRLKPIALFTEKRFSHLPDTATVAEQGYPGFQAVGFAGLFAPKGTPSEIVQKIATDVGRIVNDPTFQKEVFDRGSVPDTRTVQEWSAYLSELTTTYSEIVKKGKFKFE